MYFIAVYTNKVKEYCDKKFFENLKKAGGDIFVVDNSKDISYTERLRKFGLNVEHILVDYYPRNTLFQRNVTHSVNLLRDKFLDSKYKHFIIVESDVIVPVNLIELFEEAMPKANDWAAIGGLYHRGFHNFQRAGIDYILQTHHVLSGCAIYNRDALERFKFRWSWENIGAFPDAWWCHDINHKTDKKLYDYHKIVCEHLEKGFNDRGHKDL